MENDALIMESYFTLPDGTETMGENVSDEGAISVTVIIYINSKKFVLEVFKDGNLTLDTITLKGV